MSRGEPEGSVVVVTGAGGERRSPHVYAQPWLRVMAAVRGQAPGVVARRSAGPAATAQAARVRV